MNALNAIVANAGFELDVEYNIPFSRCMKLLKSEEVDVVTGLIHTQERQESWYLLPYGKRFSNGIYMTKERLISEELDLSTMRIGAIENYIIPKAYQYLATNIVKVGTPEQGMRMLLKNRFDAFILSTQYFNEINKHAELNNKFGLHSLMESDESYYLAFPKSEKGDANYQRLQVSLEQLQKTKVIDSIMLAR